MTKKRNGKKKRGNGEGAIGRRKDGLWYVAINLGYEGGTRRRKYFYGRTQEEVIEKRNKALSDQAQGLPIRLDRESTGVFLDRWLVDSVKPSVRFATYEQYEQHVRLYLKPSFGRVALAKLSPQHVQSFINAQLRKGLSPRTVQLSLVILRRALGLAVKWGLVARNVAKLVDSPRVKHSEVKPLTPEQARRFLKAAEGDRLEAFYTVALALGLRLGEALGVKWSDIDWDKRTLTVNRSLQRVGGKRYDGKPGSLQFVEPKTDRSRRTIILPEKVLAALKAHHRRQSERRLLLGPEWKDNDLVFPTTIGTPLDPSAAFAEFKRILAKANGPNIDAKIPAATRFHDLRHSAASLLLAQGVSMRAIMELLGHSTITLTANTYSHVLPSLQVEMAEKMDSILGSNS